MTTLSDAIAREMMDTIERERRINLDDLRRAAERVLQRLPPSTLGRIGGFDRARGRDYTGVWFNEASTFPPPPDVHADTLAGMSGNEVRNRWVEWFVTDPAQKAGTDDCSDTFAKMMRAKADKMVNPPVFVSSGRCALGDLIRGKKAGDSDWISEAVEKESDDYMKSLKEKVDKAIEDMQFYGSSVMVIDKP